MSKRYDILDVARFLAAMLVLLYHYTFRGSLAEKYSYIKYELLGDVFKYGYLGVQFFFIISGFVIFMSVQGKSSGQFVISRIVRLYPAYWFAVIFTSIALFMISSVNYEISILQIIVNLTMFQSFLGFQHIDGVYWSLTYELIFYFWMFFLIFFKKINNIYIFINLILVASTVKYFFEIPQIVKVAFLSEYGSYFVSGILFYLISKNGFSKPIVFMMTWALTLSLFQGVYQADTLNEAYSNVAFSDYIIMLSILFFYIFFFLLSLGFFDRFRFSRSMILGSLTYPVYLIHQNFGYALINMFAMDMDKYLLLGIVIFIVIFISFLINIYVEKIFGLFLYNKLKKSIFFKHPIRLKM